MPTFNNGVQVTGTSAINSGESTNITGLVQGDGSVVSALALSGSSTEYLNGAGGWTTPTGGSGSLPAMVADTNSTVVGTASATIILTYTPGSAMIIRISVSLTVITAATTVTLVAGWTDPVAGAQTWTWEDAVSVATGIRFELPLVVASVASNAVTVTITCGTANQVYVTGAMEQL